MLETIALSSLGRTCSIARSLRKHRASHQYPASNLTTNFDFRREDIAACQDNYGKTILLSVGGSTYTEGGFADYTSAVQAANNIWAIFGPEIAGSSINRPFGSAAVDGFDFDFESSVSNSVPFANQLRSLMDADSAKTGKKWFLTAAPQCPYPDAADNDMLNGQVFFDAIWVQFYNNYCGLQSFVVGTSVQNNFNFHTWDNWAKTISKNPAVKVLLGVPGSPIAAGSGYETGSTLASIITHCMQFSTFGGVMTWDMSQIYANPGFLEGVDSDLQTMPIFSSTVMSSMMKSPTSSCLIVTTTITTWTVITVTINAPSSTVAPVTSTMSTSATTTTAESGTVPRWGQCGGTGYTGPTQCAPPYSCVELSVWWSQCE